MASTDSIISISSIRKGSAHADASRRTVQATEKDNEWFIEIRDALNLDLESDYEMPVCIFLVPKPLVDVKPEAYRPQLIALGPYHHFQPELYEMEHYKLAAVKRAITPVFQLSEFENLIEEIVKQVPHICKCYRGLTAPNHDIISWIMAIDGLFLLDLLNTFINTGEISQQSTGKKQPEAYAILKDVLKLENQIPMFVLKVILERINYYFPGQLLYDMLKKFCDEVSPIKLEWSTTTRTLDKVLEHQHLLDLLYHSITFKKDNGETHPDGLTKEPPCLRPEDLPPNGEPITCAVLSDLLKMFSSLNLGNFTKKVLTLITKVLGLIHIPTMAFFKEKKVLIPSVSKLCRAGLNFCSTDGGTANVRFDADTKTFYLPIITLKHTSDVVMRNLVVYETMAKSKTKSLNFKRYTELMSAIVDTIEDVELLKKAGVLTTVPNKQKEEAEPLESDILSDAEIVEIFNEMTKTMESKDWVIDKAIGEANKCYNNTEKVKAYRLMKRYIYSSWKILTLFASLLLLLLTALQAVCDVYSCPSVFHTIKKT
ncbi:PREDICTED: putative UPF0481 protein At3g02645 [Theobroma cacao]|uniref:UPF0481 protein At3g02645 n=1 Tax=Theobroma cacao TaxID=3641 RepID=A0AB32WLF5_THECC|nr:PREDICTED: putative UPF0481 protein At3g02645 [Theobroma cacao]